MQGYSLMVMFPLTFLSNAFVPADTLPPWLEAFTKINPVSHIVTALRDLANTGVVTPEVGRDERVGQERQREHHHQ